MVVGSYTNLDHLRVIQFSQSGGIIMDRSNYRLDRSVELHVHANTLWEDDIDST